MGRVCTGEGYAMMNLIRWKAKVLPLVIGIAFLAETALAGIAVNPTVTELEVAPGRVKAGSFRVGNAGEELVRVKVEVEDWLKLRVGKSPVNIKDWFIIDEPEFELEPSEIKVISYRVMAPEGVEGELIAMVFFSTAVPGGGTLNITSRFGVSVYAGIEGTEVIDPEIREIKTNEQGLGIYVVNKGNVHLRPSGTVAIKDPGGNLIHEKKIPYTAVIFPGKAHTYPVKLDITSLSSGDYEVEAIFDTGTIFEKSKTFKKIVSLYIE